MSRQDIIAIVCMILFFIVLFLSVYLGNALGVSLLLFSTFSIGFFILLSAIWGDTL